MKIFITGASGFIGSHIVRKLSEHHEFYAMARSENSAAKIKELGAVPVICELGKVKPEHLKDCELIIHAAAFTKEWGIRSEFWEATVHGTQQLLEAAKAAGVKKFLHISTEALLFTGQDLNEIDEKYPYPEKSKFLYSESKLEAEKLVLQAHKKNESEVMVIRPRLVWGPGDQTVLPVLVNMVKEKKFVWINGGKNLTSTTHIHNLTEAVKCAIENWHGGEIYFITDGEINTYKNFLTQYLKTQGITPPDKNIPKFLVRGISDITEALWSSLHLKGTPPVTRLPAYMMSANFTIRHDKAEKELGYKPVITVKQGMEELTGLKS